MLCCWLCFRGSSVDFLADGSQGLSITVTLTSRLPNPLVFLHVSVTEDSGGGASLQRAALCCVRGSFLSSSSCEDTPETDQISSECLVYIWIQEIKRHYTAWLYVSFIVYRDIFALRVHLLCWPECVWARCHCGFVLASALDFLHADSRTLWLKGSWPQGLNWNREERHLWWWYIWELCRLHSAHKQYSSHWSNLWIFTWVWLPYEPLPVRSLQCFQLFWFPFISLWWLFEFYLVLACDAFSSSLLLLSLDRLLHSA